MKSVKVIALSLGIVLLSTLTFVGVANAQSFRAADTITVGTNEVINSMLFAGGKFIDIAGTVNGDVYCAGQTVTISGTINGDVFCAGQTITISGTVDGNVRLGGQSVTLGGVISNSVSIGAQNLIIENKSIIGRDLLGGSQNITINGRIKRDVVTGSQSLTINGKVDRNIKGGIETITIGPTGRVGGNVEYIGINDPSITSGGKIAGTVTRTTPKKDQQTSYSAPIGFAIGWFIYVLFAILTLALILAGLFPRVLNDASAATIKKPGQTVLIGTVAAIMVPVIIVILLISTIGIPAAILAMFVWLIIMIISGPFAGYLLGRALLKNQKNPIWIMLAGTSILIVTYFIPFVGFITMMAAYLFGTGMILVQSKKLLSRPSSK